MQFPSAFLTQEDTHLIRSYSLIAEAQGALTPAQLQLVYSRKWFKLMVPKYADGLEFSLPEAMHLLEAAAWADGSFGWTLNLGAGANMFAAFLPVETAKDIFHHSEMCIAGSGALTGRAEKVNGGYIINGSWKYATGATHARFFSVSCILTQNDEPIKSKEGNYETRSFIIPKHQVTISSLWNSYGLKATASHDFIIADIFVPDGFSFNLSAPSPFANGPLYKFPFLQLSEALLAVTMSGMACHFTDTLSVLLQNKAGAKLNRKIDHPAIKQAISNAYITLNNARTELYKSVERVWLRYKKGALASREELKEITTKAKQCATVSLTAAERLYPLAGMEAIVPEADINRIWRDMHTASQHILLSPFCA